MDTGSTVGKISFADVVAKVQPSVISVAAKVQQNSGIDGDAGVAPRAPD